MKKYVWYRSIFLSLLGFAITFVPAKHLYAQTSSDAVTLEFYLSPVLENAQVLGLASLGLDAKGTGPVLISGSIVNNTNETLTNLFFEFQMNAGQVGLIADVYQEAAYPFTLEPGQVVFATNNDIADEAIPGIEETMRFDGGLTPAGEDFLETLGGATILPVDIYTFTVTISQVTEEFGRQILATETLELGAGEGGSVFSELSILLKSPGDVVGSDVNITNPYPQFSWEGDAANQYRVLVVKANAQDSPESLLESAKSSEPVQNGGSLLQFENLDTRVQGNSFQFPSSGAQALIPGQTYYWQVIASVQTSGGSEELSSEIWSFKMSSPSDGAILVPIDQNTFDILIQLIGEEEYASLTESGFSFQSLEIDGLVFSGVAAVQKLSEIVQKIEDGDIIVNSN